MRIRKSVYQFRTICSNASNSGVKKEPLSAMPKPSRRDFIAIIFGLAFRVPFMVLTGLQRLEFASQALLRRPKLATLGARVNFDRCAIPASRFWLKTILRIVFSQNPHGFKTFSSTTKTKRAAICDSSCFWQGQKDLNPRHAVLETAALPTELYPCILFDPNGNLAKKWWAIRDLNPRHAVLETAALPTELYPCILFDPNGNLAKNGGPSGT